MTQNTMRMLLVLSSLFLAMDVFAGADGKQDTGGQFRLDCEQLMKTDHTRVFRLTIDAPRSKQSQMSRLVYEYSPTVPGEFSVDAKNGIHTGNKQRRWTEILLLAQWSAGDDEMPPTLMLSIKQGKKGGARAFHPIVVKNHEKISEMFSIDVKDGRHPLGKQIEIGTLGDDPIYLSLGPFPKRAD